MDKQDNINKELERITVRTKEYADRVSEAQEVVKKGIRMMYAQKKENEELKKDIISVKKTLEKEELSGEVLSTMDKILNILDQLNETEGKYGEYTKKR